MQDSSIVFEAVWPALLPSLYTLLGSIHGILSPAIRAEASKSSDFMWAFVMSPEEFHQLTGESIHPEGILPGQS